METKNINEIEKLINLKYWENHFKHYYDFENRHQQSKNIEPNTVKSNNLKSDIILNSYIINSQHTNYILFELFFKYLNSWIIENLAHVKQLFTLITNKKQYLEYCYNIIKKCIYYIYNNILSHIPNSFNELINKFKKYYNNILTNLDTISISIYNINIFLVAFKTLLIDLNINDEKQITKLLYKLIRIYIASICVILYFNNTISNNTNSNNTNSNNTNSNNTNSNNTDIFSNKNKSEIKANIDTDILIFICGSYIFIDTFIDDENGELDDFIISKETNEKANEKHLQKLKQQKFKIINNILTLQFKYLDNLDNNLIKLYNNLNTETTEITLDKCKLELVEILNNLDEKYIVWFKKNYKCVKNNESNILGKFEERFIKIYNFVFQHLLKFYKSKINNLDDNYQNQNSKNYLAYWKSYFKTYNNIIKYCFHIEIQCWKKQKTQLNNSSRLILTLQKAISTGYLWIYPNLSNYNYNNNDLENNNILNNNNVNIFKSIEWFVVFTQLLDDIHDYEDDYISRITTSCLDIKKYLKSENDIQEIKNSEILCNINQILEELDKYLEYLHLENNNISSLPFKYCIYGLINFVVYSILPHLDIINNYNNNNYLQQKILKYFQCCFFELNNLKELRKIKNDNKTLLYKIYAII